MSDRPSIGLDNAAFRGRLRQPSDGSTPQAAPLTVFVPQSVPSVTPETRPGEASALEAEASPPGPEENRETSTPPDTSTVSREKADVPMSGHRFRLTIFKKLKLDHHQMLLGVTAMAFAIFVIGVMLSLQTASSNQHAAAQVSALFKESRQAKTSPAAGALITARPSSQALDNYFTAPDLPRYISIPSLILNARVLQADPGINSTPEMPRNIHDTGWYTASAKPGQPGAMLIVGRESANNTRGVFNRLGEMKAGDQVKLVRGDNTAITYQVVKSQLHSSGAIDMQAALSPVLADKPGLNLTNCETTPEVKNQVGCTLVYASQM